MAVDEDEGSTSRTPASRSASTALFLGMVAMVAAAVVVGGVIGVIAVRMGNRALRVIDESEGRIRGRAMARAGVILGWLAMVVAVAALVMLIVMPRVAGGRNRAREVQTVGQMRAIVQGCSLYAMDNDGFFPPHLAAAMMGYGVTPAMLRDAREDGLPMVLPEGAKAGRGDWHAFAAEVDGHCDFVYVGAGLKEQDFLNPEGVILYAKKRAGKNWLVGCADGRVEEVAEGEFRILLAATSAAREKRGLDALK